MAQRRKGDISYPNLNISLIRFVNNIRYYNVDGNLKKDSKPQRDNNKPIKILNMLNHILILYLFFLPFVVEDNPRKLLDGSSYIIFKTNRTGNISIFSNEYLGEYPNIQILGENVWISVTRL